MVEFDWPRGRRWGDGEVPTESYFIAMHISHVFVLSSFGSVPPLCRASPSHVNPRSARINTFFKKGQAVMILLWLRFETLQKRRFKILSEFDLIQVDTSSDNLRLVIKSHIMCTNYMAQNCAIANSSFKSEPIIRELRATRSQQPPTHCPSCFENVRQINAKTGVYIEWADHLKTLSCNFIVTTLHPVGFYSDL